ncbi:MAG: histidine kinase [Chloroflexi bacterium]|nr:histidine kinase [Chloroflexota bacterium]
MASFLSANMFLVFFIYGLAFFITGLVVALESPRSSGLRLASSLSYLAVFGLLTGLGGWIDMMQAVPGLTPSPSTVPFHRIQPINCFACHADPTLPAVGTGGSTLLVDTLKVILLVVPSISLCYFGVRLVERVGGDRRLRLLPLGLLTLWLLTVFAVRALVSFTPEQWLINAGILARYFLLLPASILAAHGLVRERRRLLSLGVPQLASSCSWAAGFFLVSGIAGGLVVPPAPYPPADLLNYSTFFAVTGVPVQVVRAGAALAIAYFLVRVLRVFAVEHDRRLEAAVGQEIKAQQETLAAQRSAREAIEASNRELEERVSRRTRELEDRNRELAALNAIAGAVSQSANLNELLRATLDKVLGLVHATTGAIYLLDAERQTLTLEVLSGNGPWLAESGAKVMLGQGCVGTAAAEGRTVVLAADSGRTNADVPGQAVCFPLFSKGKVQGVMALVAESSQGLSAQEMDILQAIASEVGVATENAKLLDQVQNLAVLEERDRIAREMHDGLAQVLGYLNLRLRAAEGMLAQGDGVATRAEIEQAASVTQEAYADVREAILGLRTAVTPQQDLLATLSEYLRKYRQYSQVPTELSADVEEKLDLPPAAEIQLIRIIQEALTNVRKHARAKRAWVRVTRVSDSVLVEIGDDGRGFNTVAEDAREGHFGLQTMRERAESIGGSLQIDSAPGKGSRLLVTIPMASEGGRPHGNNQNTVGGRSRSLPQGAGLSAL